MTGSSKLLTTVALTLISGLAFGYAVGYNYPHQPKPTPHEPAPVAEEQDATPPTITVALCRDRLTQAQLESENVETESELGDLYPQISNTEFVRLLYRTFFDRDPANGDQHGLDNWVAVLDRGMGRGYVTWRFMASKEFQQKHPVVTVR